MSIKLDDKYLKGFVREHELSELAPMVKAAHDTLAAKNGPGSDFLGWVDLPVDYDKAVYYYILLLKFFQLLLKQAVYFG